jgi:hypothetical protein
MRPGGAALKRFVALRTVYISQIYAHSLQRRNPGDGYPEETNAPYALAKKSLLVRRRLTGNNIVSTPFTCYRSISTDRDNFDLETSSSRSDP